MVVESKQAGWWISLQVWLEWVLASTVGTATGLAVVWAILRAKTHPLVNIVSLLLFGFLVGAMQWLVLRRLLPRVGWWVLATTLGWAGGVFALGLLAGKSIISWVAAGVAFGAVPAAMQWLVLRRRVSWASWWPVATIPGMCACVFVFLVATRGADTDIPGIAGGGAMGGALYGAITGVALVWLLRNRFPQNR